MDLKQQEFGGEATSLIGSNGVNGKSAFEVWESVSANKGKTQADYLADIKGATGSNGTNGKSAFEVWESVFANKGKGQADYLADIKGLRGSNGNYRNKWNEWAIRL